MSDEGSPVKGKSAVLLLAHGTPDVLGEMAEYLSKVTGGRALPDEVVKELQHRYAQIGLRETPGVETPPLTKWTMTQAYLLEQALGAGKVYVGMRNWHPYIADVVDEMRKDGVTHIKAVCLGCIERLCCRLQRESKWSSLLAGRRAPCWRKRSRTSYGPSGRRLARKRDNVCRSYSRLTVFRAGRL